MPDRLRYLRLVFVSTCAILYAAGDSVLNAQSPVENLGLNPPIKVMSFNIRYGSANDGDNRWERRADLVAETIALFDPDILGMQEVLDFQAQFLQERLPGYTFHGAGRDDGESQGEFAPVMFKSDRFDLIDAGHFWLSETPDTPGSRGWDAALPRLVSWVHLGDKQAPTRQSNGSSSTGPHHPQLVVFNTHFDHRGRVARLHSAQLLRKRADEFAQRGIPLIITGDFNTTEDQRPYAELVNGGEPGQLTLLDSYRQHHQRRSEYESTFSAWRGNRKGSRIDWILHSPDFTTLQSMINGTHDGDRYPSDHYPVQAILRLR